MRLGVIRAAMCAVLVAAALVPGRSASADPFQKREKITYAIELVLPDLRYEFEADDTADDSLTLSWPVPWVLPVFELVEWEGKRCLSCRKRLVVIPTLSVEPQLRVSGTEWRGVGAGRILVADRSSTVHVLGEGVGVVGQDGSGGGFGVGLGWGGILSVVYRQLWADSRRHDVSLDVNFGSVRPGSYIRAIDRIWKGKPDAESFFSMSELIWPDVRFEFSGGFDRRAWVLAAPIPIVLPHFDLWSVDDERFVDYHRFRVIPQVIVEPQIKVHDTGGDNTALRILGGLRGFAMDKESGVSGFVEGIGGAAQDGHGGGLGVALGFRGLVSLGYRSEWTTDGHRHSLTLDVQFFSLPYRSYIARIKDTKERKRALPRRRRVLPGLPVHKKCPKGYQPAGRGKCRPIPVIRDRDGDGIDDDKDECPDKPEDMDGYNDGDGCPDKRGPIDATSAGMSGHKTAT